MASLFITFEGIEGSGKSTQLKLLHEVLIGQGRKVLVTREPGGTVIAEAIRKVLLSPDHKDMSPMTELMLYAAARAEHVGKVIRPALAEGHTVLCDRYTDATDAYQGSARHLDPETLKTVHQLSTQGLKPQLTLLFDCPVDVGLERAKARNVKHSLESEARFENEDKAFHERVRAAYLAIAKNEPTRIKVIDTIKSKEVVHREVVKIVNSYVV